MVMPYGPVYKPLRVLSAHLGYIHADLSLQTILEETAHRKSNDNGILEPHITGMIIQMHAYLHAQNNRYC